MHGYLPQQADYLTFVAPLCKCFHDCHGVAGQFDPTGSGLGCVGVQCMLHCLHFFKVGMFGFMPLWDRGTEEPGWWVYARQCFACSHKTAPDPVLSRCVSPQP